MKKREVVRVAKAPDGEDQLVENPLAWKKFLDALDEFRRKRKYVRFMKIKPFMDYLSSKKKMDDFKKLSSDLEEMRCKILGMSESRFYKLVSEFTVVPNGIKYYNPQHLFGADASYEAEEFRTRIYETMYNINWSVGQRHLDTRPILEFIKSLDDMGTVVEVRGAMVLDSKDWFCLVAVRDAIERRGWTEEEARRRMKVFYRRCVRKVYPEKLLHDIVKGELDRIGTPTKLKANRRDMKAIESQSWYEEWKNGLKK